MSCMGGTKCDGVFNGFVPGILEIQDEIQLQCVLDYESSAWLLAWCIALYALFQMFDRAHGRLLRV